MSAKKNHFFELRSGYAETLLFILKTLDLDELQSELLQRFESTPEFFENDAVVVDLRLLEEMKQVDLDQVFALLRDIKMKPVGVAAQDHQLSWVKRYAIPLIDIRDYRQNLTENKRQETTPVETSRSTLLIDKPLRSGQQIYAPGDLIMMAVVSHGAEVIAEGNIHIYAPLRGRALAGVRGNQDARIFCTCFEPELISIAGIYRTSATSFSEKLIGKPVQVQLSGESLLVESLNMK